MKKYWKVLLIAGVLLVAIFGLACVERPEKPICSEGFITVEEATWVDGYWKTVEVCEEVPVYEYLCDGVGVEYTYYN